MTKKLDEIITPKHYIFRAITNIYQPNKNEVYYSGPYSINGEQIMVIASMNYHSILRCWDSGISIHYSHNGGYIILLHFIDNYSCYGKNRKQARDILYRIMELFDLDKININDINTIIEKGGIKDIDKFLYHYTDKYDKELWRKINEIQRKNKNNYK